MNIGNKYITVVLAVPMSLSPIEVDVSRHITVIGAPLKISPTLITA